MTHTSNYPIRNARLATSTTLRETRLAALIYDEGDWIVVKQYLVVLVVEYLLAIVVTSAVFVLVMRHCTQSMMGLFYLIVCLMSVCLSLSLICNGNGFHAETSIMKSPVFVFSFLFPFWAAYMLISQLPTPHVMTRHHLTSRTLLTLSSRWHQVSELHVLFFCSGDTWTLSWISHQSIISMWYHPGWKGRLLTTKPPKPVHLRLYLQTYTPVKYTTLSFHQTSQRLRLSSPQLSSPLILSPWHWMLPLCFTLPF